MSNSEPRWKRHQLGSEVRAGMREGRFPYRDSDQGWRPVSILSLTRCRTSVRGKAERPFVGKYVRMTGIAFERNGTHAIVISEIMEMKKVHVTLQEE
jgi:hypothetical protein